MRGQVETMEVVVSRAWRSACVGAIVLAYLLIVVNFQSWLDPFIIITALPGALAGIVWTLLLTHTTLNVPSLTGAIMCMGVATANSILLVSFAREQMTRGHSAHAAALEAGTVRIRPVLMTALAMIIGMLPMAIGLGEGGEQNAPLGRAVAGGLMVATFATLFFVPCVFDARFMDGRGAPRPAPSGVLMTDTHDIPPDARFFVGLGRRRARARRRRRGHARRAPRRVARARARRPTAVAMPTVVRRCIRRSEGADEDLVLPSTLAGRRRVADLRAHVRLSEEAGRTTSAAAWRRATLLAEIDTPEVDQELAQAKAARQQISANLDLAKSTAERWDGLRKTDAVSQQEVDEKKSAYAQLQANLAAADANVQRLEQLESFKRIYAPFAGVITQRNVDVGTLINAGNGGAHAAAVPPVADRSDPRVRAGARIVGARRSTKACGESRADAVSGRAVRGPRRPHGGLDRSGHAHAADRGRRAEPRRPAAARRLRAGAPEGRGAQARG